MKKIKLLSVIMAVSIFTTGCAQAQNSSVESESSETEIKHSASAELEMDLSLTNVLGTEPDDIVPLESLNWNVETHETGYQVEEPEVGEEIAVITTNMGTVTIRFFPEVAPKAVYNFKKLAQQGFYDGIIFHRVMDNFMIQGGDETGIGSGGQSVWGEKFEDEFSPNLFNITGAVSMANSGPGTNSSQFFINNTTMSVDWASMGVLYDMYLEDESVANAYTITDMTLIDDAVKSLYEEYGGNANLDGGTSLSGRGHTVFAQVIDGMDTVEAIAKVAVNSAAKPMEDVVIEKIEIQTYN